MIDDSFISTGVVNFSDNPIANAGLNIGLGIGLEYVADRFKVSISRDLLKRGRTDLSEKTSRSIERFIEKRLKKKEGGVALRTASSIFFGVSNEDRLVGALYNKTINGRKPPTKFLGIQVGGKANAFTPMRFSATREFIREKFFKKAAGPLSTRVGGKIGSLAFKEIAATSFGALNRVTGISLMSDLMKSSLFLSGVVDYEGIYKNRGMTEMHKQYKANNILTMSQGFHDNRGAATMRQRGLAAIYNTQMNIQQVFGAEASYIHN